MHQLISQHFPDTRSLLTIIQNSINAEGGISIKIEEDIAIRDAFTTHQEDEFMQEDNKYSFSDLGMKIEPESKTCGKLNCICIYLLCSWVSNGKSISCRNL